MHSISHRYQFIILAIGVLLLITAGQASSSYCKGSYSATDLGETHMTFTENHGQWDERVRFVANSGGATIWFTADGVCHQFQRRIESNGNPTGNPVKLEIGDRYAEQASYEQLVINASFVGANPDPKVVGLTATEYKCNYFIGNDPDKWYTDVPNYRKIIYEDIYAGIDLQYFDNGERMEYDFIVAPGADPNQIMVHYDGVESISVNDDGELVVETEWGTVTEMRPLVFQLDAYGLIPIDGQYVVFTDNTFGFDLGDEYDPTLVIVIDPELSYSTYLGGSGGSTGDDRGYAIEVDGSSALYVTGYTRSTDFPTVNPYQGTLTGSHAAFVTKFSPDGSSLVYSTYLGGGLDDRGIAIAIDGSGVAYVTGWTQSLDFPTTASPFQTDQGSIDAFLTKLSSSGNSLVYSTYIGGGNMDQANGIVVDGSGMAYVAGSTSSTNFPTLNPYQATFQGNWWDGFVMKFSSSGNSLVYSTYLGGDSTDLIEGMVVNDLGETFVVGHTNSTNFPTQNPYQGTNQGDRDAFVTKLAATGSSLVYSTYLGGTGADYGWGIALDVSEVAYVTGWTESTDFPTVNPYQSVFQGGLSDVFVAKFASSGSGLEYSTYIGGDGEDDGWKIVIDNTGTALITGHTLSTNFPTLDPYQTDQGGDDVFVTKLAGSGSSLVYSTYLGGSGHDFGYDIALDGSGAAYVTGYTESTNFPTVNAYQGTYQGGIADAFVTKLIGEPPYICGDADGSGEVDIDDVVYLITYIFSGGPAPDPLASGDADCAGGIDIDDVVYLISYIFSGGNAPCDPNGDAAQDC